MLVSGAVTAARLPFFFFFFLCARDSLCGVFRHPILVARTYTRACVHPAAGYP